ncbi:MAG: energy-coupling factor ABC transporter ATP-binding protein [Chloroflexi bacterium]|nr:energy-coupling factor ABC transporter ATP-binding protein [Chloroflexota bacterium]
MQGGLREATHPALAVDALEYTYEGSTTSALRGLDLTVESGSMTLLVGPTGAGKTTLALATNGIVPHLAGGTKRGRVLVAGLDTDHHPIQRLSSEVGVVFQDPESQLCTLYLEDEVAFAPENLRLPVNAIRSRIADALRRTGLTSVPLSKSVFELSGGQKQRVNIASILAMSPTLLVADMPTANLDPRGSAEVFQVLNSLVRDRGLTCLVIENRLDDLVPLADNLVVMVDGRAVAQGDPTTLLTNHGVTMRDDLGIELPQLAELLLHLAPALGNSGDLRLDVASVAAAIDGGIRNGRLRLVQPSRGPRPATRDAIASFQHVSFRYPDGTAALDDVSFGVGRGELVAVLGNNGSGKTTAAKLLVNLLQPTAGNVEVLGQAPNRHAPRELARRVAYVFQYPEHQFVTQRVRSELEFNLRQLGRPPAVVGSTVDQLLERFGLGARESDSPYALSGGEMRALSVACMLTTEPELLILDEPTYGQDRHRIRALLRHLEEVRAAGTSILIITHDMRLASDHADRVVVMNQGRVVANDTPGTVFQLPDILELSGLKAPPVYALAESLRGLGHQVPAFDRSEDLFELLRPVAASPHS